MKISTRGKAVELRQVAKTSQNVVQSSADYYIPLQVEKIK